MGGDPRIFQECGGRDPPPPPPLAMPLIVSHYGYCYFATLFPC